MEKTSKMPIWVYLAFSSINTRNGALWLISACVLFSLYCVPWPLLITDSDWIMSIFLIDDWSWFAMMVPVVAWYVLAFKWVEKNGSWEFVDENKS